MIEARLLLDGYEVHTAGDGLLGFQKIQELKPRLIILDATLPKMSGYKLVEQLKTLDRSLNRIPIVVIADKTQIKDLFRSSDVFHILLKPLRPTQLMKQVGLAIKLATTTNAPQHKFVTLPKGIPRVLLAGVQPFILEKMRAFFQQKGWYVEISWEEKDLIQRAELIKPNYIFVQFWEEITVLNTPEIVKLLGSNHALWNIPYFIFCQQDIVLDAQELMPEQPLIKYRESQDLLVSVKLVLR